MKPGYLLDEIEPDAASCHRDTIIATASIKLPEDLLAVFIYNTDPIVPEADAQRTGFLFNAYVDAGYS
jgi:hypothetical protein